MAYYQIALRILLSFIIAVSPIILINSANAANVGGWSLSNAVAQGASTVYDATKNVLINGKDFVKKSTVKITPTATGVAKVLARGGAGYALSVAVEQLLGAVDWVLDPTNNQIKYKPKDETSPFPPPDQNYQYECAPGKVLANSIQECGARYISLYPQYNKYSDCKRFSGDSISCLFTYTNSSRQENVAIGKRVLRVQPINPPKEQEEKTLPLEVVAQKVISNAENGDNNAQIATTAAAADVVAEAEKDDAKARPIANQAEANAETKPADEAEAEKANEAQGQSKPNEANPEATDISLEFPVFCSWAPTICEAAQVVISFPNTLTGWYTDTKTKAEEWAASIADSWAAVKDWATTEKPEEPTELEIPQPEQQTIDTDVYFNASCPAPYTLASFTAFGSSHNWTIDFSDMCSAITTFVRPVVIAMGALSAALIVGGVRDNG